LSQVTHDFKEVSSMKQFAVQKVYMLQSTQGLAPPWEFIDSPGDAYTSC